MIQKQDSVQNNFIKGIITEASPLTFPANSSLNEVNFKLNRDGSRDRRLGIDFEDGFVMHSTGYTADQLSISTRSFYRWPNPNGNENLEIGIIQIGGYLFFVNLLSDAPSANLLNGGLPINTGARLQAQFEYALMGTQVIVVSTDLADPFLANYNVATDQITYEHAPIMVRDLVGVQDDLRIDERPTSLSPAHRYNLMNQGWLTSGIETTCGPGVSAVDCTFNTFGVYPSNSDAWSIGRIEDVTNANVKKYDPNIAARFLINSGQAAKGHYIIHAFDRGASRRAASGIPELPLDRELGRISTVASYAGRAWYAGVRSKLEGVDNRSPNINGIIFYSQVMQSAINLVQCYQEADPTSPDINDGVDTDGGYIVIPEVTTIVKLLAIKSSLFVFAENGIWEIRGGDSGFRAFDWQVNKISGMGVASHRSIIEVNGGIFFWSYDGIYALVQSDTGQYDTQSITIGTIQTLYNNLPDSARRTAKGYYDAANNKLRWLYHSEEAAYSGNPGPIIGGGGVPVPFDLQALLNAGVANILAGVGSDYRLNVDINNAFVAFQHKDAVYNGSAGAGPIRPAIGLSSAGIAMGYNDLTGNWVNAVAIEADGDASFRGTVAANSILTNTIQLGSSVYTVADIITLLGTSPTTFDLQGALNAGVGYILAGTGGNYRLTVDPTNAFVAFHHKDALYNGTSAVPAAGQTALGISASGIAMGYNHPTTGVWTNAVSITSAGDATFKGTVAADSVIANNVAVAGKSTTLGQMADDISTFVGGSFNLQAALNAGVTNILAGTGANYKLTVDTTNAFVAFHHKDAVYNGVATTGTGNRPAIGLSAAGMGMGYNRSIDGAWVNAVSIDTLGNALFAGTIAANSIITNSATINGVSVGTIQTNSSNAAIHAALTGNVHNVALAEITGDLDDIADGSAYFKTNAAEKAGGAKANTALDGSGNYIRTLLSTRIVVSDTNPSTGWVADGQGIRLYQSGSLTVNLPVSGSPSFSGNISGGGNITITGTARFDGNTSDAGVLTAILANSSRNQSNGLRAYAGVSGGNGVYGNANNSTGTGYGAFFRRQTGTEGAACIAISSTSAPGMIAQNDGTGLALQVLGNADVGGEMRCNSIRMDQSPTTGAGNATFTGLNKPGGASTNQWMSISANGVTRYFPVWS